MRARPGLLSKNCASCSGGGHLPVLVLTGDVARGGLLARLRRPKALVLPKPFHEIDLQQSVVKMVGQSLA